MYFLLSILVSLLLVADLFLTPGHSAYMDGIAHLTTLTQFYESMKQGIWRVAWTDGFANYGMPIPLYIHQTVGYLGGWLSFVFRGDVVMVYKVMFLIGAVVSSAVFYRFLRIYYKALPSFLGVLVMNFAPYRIMNLYIREALPEFLAAVMFPAILLATYNFVKKKTLGSRITLTIVFTLIALSHPMMLIVGSVLFALYFLFLIRDEKEKIKIILDYGLHMVWGIGIAAYYLIPLVLENKYFYYGLQANHLTGGQYLSLNNYFNPRWYYFFIRDVANRGHFVKGGLLESIIMVVGTGTLIWQLAKNKVKTIQLWHCAWAVGVILIFLTTKYSNWLYTHINMLANIQFPWRMLSAYIYIPAILVAAFFEKIRTSKYYKLTVLVFVAMVLGARYPQIYAKNNTMHDIARYYFTPINLHSTVMNTVWTGETTEYPIKDHKIEVIEGEAEVQVTDNRYGRRKYTIKSDQEVRMVDYTFYFPGWVAKVDGRLVEIEFQDPNYRGVITYHVPAGEHTVELFFGDTKLRKISILISEIMLGLFILYIVWLKVSHFFFQTKRL